MIRGLVADSVFPFTLNTRSKPRTLVVILAKVSWVVLGTVLQFDAQQMAIVEGGILGTWVWIWAPTCYVLSPYWPSVVDEWVAGQRKLKFSWYDLTGSWSPSATCHIERGQWNVGWYLHSPFGSADGRQPHYSVMIMSALASQITGVSIIYSTVYSGADQRKQKSKALCPWPLVDI